MTSINQSGAPRTAKRDTTTLTLLGAMFLALAIICGASLSAVGSGALHEAMNVIGFGRTGAIESEQQRQAAVLADLGRAVQTVSSDVAAVSARVKLADHNDVALNDRFTLIDADIAALVAEIRSLRATRSDTASDTWRGPVERLDNAVSAARTDFAERLDSMASATRTDIVALRSSFDEHHQAYRKDIATITKRLDRLEQFAARELTGSIHTPVRKKQVRRKPRAIEAVRSRARSTQLLRSAATPQGMVVPEQYRPDPHAAGTWQ
jgi:hypothetical protein